MDKRIIVGKTEGSTYIDYKIEGCGDRTYTCNGLDWEAYELKLKIFEAGLDEGLLDELYRLGYQAGRDSVYEDQGSW